MPVFVDAPRHRVGQMIMCHMLADSVDELMAMADRIGVDRKWFQPHSHPHFDICKSARAQAIAAGAIEVSNRELVEVMKRYRRLWFADPVERAALEAVKSATGKGGGDADPS
jgi:hypothetical protein